MDGFWHNYTSIVASVMSIYKDRHDNCGKEVDDKKTKHEEISFREVFERAISNHK